MLFWKETLNLIVILGAVCEVEPNYFTFPPHLDRPALYFILYTGFFTHYTLYWFLYTLYFVLVSLHIIFCTGFFTHYTLYRFLYTVYFIRVSLHNILYTGFFTHYTLMYTFCLSGILQTTSIIFTFILSILLMFVKCGLYNALCVVQRLVLRSQ